MTGAGVIKDVRAHGAVPRVRLTGRRIPAGRWASGQGESNKMSNAMPCYAYLDLLGSRRGGPFLRNGSSSARGGVSCVRSFTSSHDPVGPFYQRHASFGWC